MLPIPQVIRLLGYGTGLATKDVVLAPACRETKQKQKWNGVAHIF